MAQATNWVETMLQDLTFKVIPLVLILILTTAMSVAAVYTFGNSTPLPKTDTRVFIILISVVNFLYVFVLYIRRKFYTPVQHDAELVVSGNVAPPPPSPPFPTPVAEVSGESPQIRRLPNPAPTNGPTNTTQWRLAPGQYMPYVPGGQPVTPMPAPPNMPVPGTHAKSRKSRRLESPVASPCVPVEPGNEAGPKHVGRVQSSSFYDQSEESGSVSSLTTVDSDNGMEAPVQAPKTIKRCRERPGKLQPAGKLDAPPLPWSHSNPGSKNVHTN
jgi:hypothetical protein